MLYVHLSGVRLGLREYLCVEPRSLKIVVLTAPKPVWKHSFCSFCRRSQRRSMKLRQCMKKLHWKSSPLPSPRWSSPSRSPHLSCAREMMLNMVAVFVWFYSIMGPLISPVLDVTLPRHVWNNYCISFWLWNCLLELLMTKTDLVFRVGNCESCLLQVNLIKGPVTCFGIFFFKVFCIISLLVR